MVEVHTIIGYLAAVSLITTLLPQLYFTYKTKKVDDLSYFFIFMQILTCILFLIYGILLKETPLLLANSMVVTQSIILLILKKIYTK